MTTRYIGSILGLEPPPDDLDPDYWSEDFDRLPEDDDF